MSRKTLILKIISDNIEHTITTISPLYKLRYAILNMCLNRPNSKPKAFIFDEWRNNPSSFYKWCLDNGWKKGLMLSRINIEDGYYPDNCRIVTVKYKYNAQKKLTDKEVLDIRDKLKLGIKPGKLSAQYGISKCHISSIKNNKARKGAYGNYDQAKR